MAGKFLHNFIFAFACLAMAFFVMANKPCFAVDSPSFGAFSDDGTPIQLSFSSSSDLYDLIDLAYSSRTNTSVSPSSLVNALSSLGFDSIVSSYDFSEPSFFFNLYEVPKGSYTYIAIPFVRSSFSEPSYTYNIISSNWQYVSLIAFDSIYTPSFIPYGLSFIPFNPVTNDYANFHDIYFPRLSIVGNNLVSFPSVHDNFTYCGESFDYSIYDLSYFDFQSYLNSNYHLFTLYLCFNNDTFDSSLSGFTANVAFEFSSSYRPIMSLVYGFDFSSSYTFASSGFFYSSEPFYIYKSVFNVYDTSFSLNGFSSYGLSFDSVVPSLPTPTSIPPWRDSELPTPTAFPSVTVAPLPTGIVTDFIPLLDLPSTESTLSNITGIIKEFNSVFSRKVFALGSYTLQVMYYFSGWFKFIFLVPAGVFIAFLIGRLRKK